MKVDKLWKVIDANDDGVLSFEEFADWLTKPRSLGFPRLVHSHVEWLIVIMVPRRCDMVHIKRLGGHLN